MHANPSKNTSKVNFGAGNPSQLGLIQPKGYPPFPEDWRSTWETFTGSGGTHQLFGIRHEISPLRERPVRVLVILHGHGEHGGRYLHFPHYLRDTMDIIYCLDLPGHGRSEGNRGHIEKFDQYADDAALCIRRLRDWLGRKKCGYQIHLLGHSMGGLIALRLLQFRPDVPFRSAVISAPLLGLGIKVPLYKKLLARGISGVFGSLQMDTHLDVTQLSHDEEVQKCYQSDRLVHSLTTPRAWLEMTQAMRETLKEPLEPGCPLFFMVPTADQIVNPEVTLEYASKLETRSNRIKTYEGYRHEIFNEGGATAPDGVSREIGFRDLKRWLEDNSS